METNKPRVSIGMPVFNGEKYIKNAINSILRQTYADFLLIISDNASTDRTQQICLDYVRKDNRIHYYRNKKNLGAPNNYNRVFELSDTEYFKWAAYDDVLSPDFLEKCIAVLDSDSSIIGCHCKTGRIDQNGVFLGYYNEGLLERIDSVRPHERFRDLIGLYYTTTPFHGVYHSEIMAKSQRHGSYIGADRNLVAELSLMGRIYQIPECLFFWREHPESYTQIFYGHNREFTLDRLIGESNWWSKDKVAFFPHWRTCLEYFKSVNRIPLGVLERLLCYKEIVAWLLVEGGKFLAKDVLDFIFQRSRFVSKIMQNLPLSLKRLLQLFVQ